MGKKVEGAAKFQLFLIKNRGKDPFPLPDVLKQTGLSVAQMKRYVLNANAGEQKKSPRCIRLSEANMTLTIPADAHVDIKRYAQNAPKLLSIAGVSREPKHKTSR